MPISPSLPLLRRLGFGRSDGPAPRYTAREVRALLGPAAVVDDRGQAVLATAAVPSSWAEYLPDDEAWRLGRAAARLPTIVFWYRSGLSLEAIGRRLGVFAGPWLAERALEAAAGCIAERLNDRGTPAVRGAV